MATLEEINPDVLGDGDGLELSKPETELEKPLTELDDDDDEDLDETLAERLIGLTEMFPEGLRNLSWSLSSFSVSATKWLYSASRTGMWVAASSACILALPIMFETERAQMEEQQLQQQRQLLLGPNAATAGGAGPMPQLAAVPPPQR